MADWMRTPSRRCAKIHRARGFDSLAPRRLLLLAQWDDRTHRETSCGHQLKNENYWSAVSFARKEAAVQKRTHHSLQEVTMKLCLSLVLVLLLHAPALSAARIYHLEASKWAIICDNGNAFTFSGSANGVAEVSELLCGGSIAATGAQSWVRFSTLQDADSLVVRAPAGGWQLTSSQTAATARTFRGYPPHGYPCLGCAPCPGNPNEFCDITGIMHVHPRAAHAGFAMSGDGRLTTQRESHLARSTSATRIEGSRWAIICANGGAYSFAGSEANVPEVAPILCAAPSTPRVGAPRDGGSALQWMQAAEQLVVQNARTGRWQRR
ncbi:MAG TPA: hypothetical protein VLK84_31595 [Longimicrobium sp.]|nr:hypothetical protein [Longimicrobium sp.]